MVKLPVPGMDASATETREDPALSLGKQGCGRYRRGLDNQEPTDARQCKS